MVLLVGGTRIAPRQSSLIALFRKLLFTSTKGKLAIILTLTISYYFQFKILVPFILHGLVPERHRIGVLAP